MVRKASWPTSSFSADSVVQPVHHPAETERPSLLQSLVDEVGGTCTFPRTCAFEASLPAGRPFWSGRWPLEI
jgi:hypothetical protein